MKSSSFGARTSGSRTSSSSPKSMPGIGCWASWRRRLVYLFTSRISSGMRSSGEVDRDDRGTRPMGSGTFGINVP